MRENLANFKPSGEGVDLGAWDLETHKPALAHQVMPEIGKNTALIQR